MRVRANYFFGRARKANARSLVLSVGFLLLISGSLASAGHAQQRDPNANVAPTSDLAFQNLSRVAATSSEIKAVLIRDSGLMVELKQWVARDATNHGQVVIRFRSHERRHFRSIRVRHPIPFRGNGLATALWLSFAKGESGVGTGKKSRSYCCRSAQSGLRKTRKKN